MKFYSEKLNQLFDSEDALVAAEKSASSKKKSTSKKESTQTDKINPVEAPSKKQLACEVEAADEKVREAYANYDTAQKQAEELSKTYLTELCAILDPAKKAIEAAEKERYFAIKRFNDSFGAYQVTYTGAKAADEMLKAINNLNERSSRAFKEFFWF
jgi:hypothetical protein